MISAASTPGTHPQHVRIVVIKKDPQPWSITASGGQIMLNKTLKQDIAHLY